MHEITRNIYLNPFHCIAKKIHVEYIAYKKKKILKTDIFSYDC